jgi:hypothetical protein
MGNWERAESDLAATRELDPDGPPSICLEAIVRVGRGDTEGALRVLTQALPRLSPDRQIPVLLERARFYREVLHDAARAAADERRARAISRDAVDGA